MRFNRIVSNRITLTLVIAAVIMALFGCKGEKMKMSKVTYKSIKDVPDATWEKLGDRKIFFAHQSVGFNIIDGMRDIMDEHPAIKLHIVETTDPEKFKRGIFAHSRVGRNLDTQIKIDEFVNYINNGIGEKVDAVALKFCYLDMTAKTDANKIFSNYQHAVSELQKKYPDMIVIHFTEPLTTSRTTWKTWIKKIIGKKEIWEYDDNIRRNEYNKLLRNKYEGKEPIMDIARMESTYPDGSRCSFEKDGETYYSMVPEYTTDGGHLNKIGRKKVAEQFLILLASLTP